MHWNQLSLILTIPTFPPSMLTLAAHRKQLTVGQASALCDLYEAQYDLVRAAWEVFCVQGNDPTKYVPC